MSSRHSRRAAVVVRAAALAFAAGQPIVALACDLHAVSDFSLNLTGATGHSTNTSINNTVSTISADVTWVRYDASNAYVKSTGVPSHDVGPFAGNPNVPANQNFTFRVPRSPSVNNGTKTATSLGPIGFMVNGVAFFNASDGHTYNNQGVWTQNANVVEAASFDAAMGHPQQSGVYHYHQQPLGLRQQLGDDGSHHSPLLGFAFDGFPVYGPYGYANADGTGGVERLDSSYQLRNMTTRTTKPDGTALTAAQYGPAVSAQYPLGYYLEDYAYVVNSGDLDAYNGRFSITPEYPQGTYAYFTTLDALGKAAYPYIIGPQYYGTLQNDNRTQTVSVPGSAGTFDAVLSATWTSASDGTWCGGSNWSGGSAPAGAATTATFADVGGAPANGITITIDSPQRVGTINFNTASTRTIAGNTQLTILSSTGSRVNVTAGDHVISSPTVLASATTINIASGSSLRMSNLQASAAPITKSGAGMLTLDKLNTTTLTISSGTVAFAKGASTAPKVTSLNRAAGATLDVNDNDLLIDYATGATSPLATVRSAISTARNGGAWNGAEGITSSAARASGMTTLAAVEAPEYASLHAGTTSFSNQSIDSSGVVVKYTWNGDANLSGTVSFDDYVKIDTGFNTHLTGWTNGDFNYDGTVNFDDYVLIDVAFNAQNGTLSRAVDWISGDDRSGSGRTATGVESVIEHFDQFGAAYGQAFLAAVPEPCVMSVMIPLALMRRGRMRRAWR